MNTIRQIIFFATHPKRFLGVMLSYIAPFIKDDEIFIRLRWKLCMDYPLNLENPQTFNEKLQWLKLHDRKPIYTSMVDKNEAKKYVANIIGDEYIIPTLAVYDKVEDIDFDKLPNQFVLKWTHDSGGLVICKEKSKLNVGDARKKLKKGESSNYFWRNREWPYKDVHPRIIAEQYMVDESEIELKDYKFFCFNGKVKCLKVDFGRFKEHHANYYDTDMNLLPFGEVKYPPNYNHTIIKPKNFKKMIELAEKLSKYIPFLRVDFYNINGKIYFGELTFFPASGMGKIQPMEWDSKLGSWIELLK